MKDPTVWADSKCSQRPKEEPAEDWNVQEDFLEVVELEQGSEVHNRIYEGKKIQRKT